MAKTRAQRKAERRKREAQQAGGQGAGAEQARAQHKTQVPESGDVAEVEAIMETGAQPEELGESVRPAARSEPAAPPDIGTEAPIGFGALETEEEPAESEAPAAPTESRRERKRREREEAAAKEARRRAREKKPAEVEERRRGAVVGFILSCWAELKRVQWPDRETLIQASAVTVLFVAVCAAYLGALDALFSWLVDRII